MRASRGPAFDVGNSGTKLRKLRDRRDVPSASGQSIRNVPSVPGFSKWLPLVLRRTPNRCHPERSEESLCLPGRGGACLRPSLPSPSGAKQFSPGWQPWVTGRKTREGNSGTDGTFPSSPDKLLRSSRPAPVLLNREAKNNISGGVQSPHANSRPRQNRRTEKVVSTG